MKNKSLFIVFILSIIVFLNVSFVFNSQNGFMYDEIVAKKIASFSSSSIQSFMEGVSLFGSSEVILLLTVIIGIVLLFQRNWYHLFLFFVLSVGGVVLNFSLKMAFQRERPGDEASLIEVFNYSFEIPSYSFPSGHTMRATILLLYILYIVAREFMQGAFKTSIYIIMIGLILLVATSRLFLEAHFLSDTIAAISVSIAWFCIIVMIFQKIFSRNKPTYPTMIGM